MKKNILRNELNKIIKKNNYRFHMPGHKGKGKAIDFYDYDITEIPGADNLHDAHGILEQVQKKCACLYHSDAAAILINGTTTGIQSAILGALASDEQLLVPTNSHRSVFGALVLGRVDGVFIHPEMDETVGFGKAILVEHVQEALAQNPKVAGMILTNPTYYGTISDVKKIAEVLHEQGKFLIVDEAHGAHLHFSDCLPIDAIAAGADVVIQSTHKILGSLTQSALLHFQGNRIARQRVQFFLSLLQSSSPSYPLMMSVEEAMDEVAEEGKETFEHIVKAHSDYGRNQDVYAPIALYGEKERLQDYDRSKWLFHTSGVSGKEIEKRLLETYGIQCEMSAENYVLAMTGIHTTVSDLEHLTQAIEAINRTLKTEKDDRREAIVRTARKGTQPSFQTEVPFWQVTQLTNREKVKLNEANERMVTDFIIPYPPGIPALLPGSRMDSEMMAYLSCLLDHGITVVGIDVNREVEVVKMI